MTSPTLSKEILTAALTTLEQQGIALDKTIAEVRRQLGGKSSAAAKSPHTVARSVPGKKQKRQMSPEARKRIADAQKKRWAAYRKNKK